MADVTLAVQKLTMDGVAPSFTGSLSISDTYRVNNDGKTIIHFKKSGAGACIVTFDTPRTVAGLAIAQHTVTIPATTGDVMIKDLAPQVFNQIGTGFLEFTVDEVTGLSVGVFE